MATVYGSGRGTPFRSDPTADQPLGHTTKANQLEGLQYDDQGRPYFEVMVWSKEANRLVPARTYPPPVALRGGVNPADTTGMWRSFEWNPYTGKFDKKIEWARLVSAGILGTIGGFGIAAAATPGVAGGGAAASGGASAPSVAGATTTAGIPYAAGEAALLPTGAGVMAPLGAAQTVPYMGALPAGAASSLGGVGGAAAAGVNAANAAANTGTIQGPGIAGVEGWDTLGQAGGGVPWGKVLGYLAKAGIPIAAGLTGRALSGSGGGAGDGSAEIPQELKDLLAMSMKRMADQQPLADAINTQALGGLPTYAKRGGGQ